MKFLCLFIFIFMSFYCYSSQRYFLRDGICQNEKGQRGRTPGILGICGKFGSYTEKNISLKNLPFSKKDLSGIGFFFSNLVESKFTDVKIDFALFKECRMKNTLFQNVSGQNSSFIGSSLQFAGFISSQLKNSSFIGSKVVGTRFFNSDLRGAKFIAANLSFAIFKNSQLQGADFSEAVLIGTQFVGSKFDKETILPFSKNEAIQKGMTFVSAP